MAGVVVLDANVLIAAYDDTNAHHAWAVDLLTLTTAEDLVISALTYAEVLVRPAMENVLDEFRRDVDPVGYKVLDITAESAIATAQVRAQSKLRMPDAVVLQAALEHRGAIATADASLAAAALSHGVTVYRP